MSRDREEGIEENQEHEKVIPFGSHGNVRPKPKVEAVSPAQFFANAVDLSQRLKVAEEESRKLQVFAHKVDEQFLELVRAKILKPGVAYPIGNNKVVAVSPTTSGMACYMILDLWFKTVPVVPPENPDLPA